MIQTSFRSLNSAGVTKRQEILSFIKAFRAANDYPPSIREIGAATNLASTSTVHHHLTELERDGLITMGGKTIGHRSICIVPGLPSRTEVVTRSIEQLREDVDQRDVAIKKALSGLYHAHANLSPGLRMQLAEAIIACECFVVARP